MTKDKENSEFSKKYLIRWLLDSYVGKYKKQLIIAVICMAITAGTAALNAYIIRPVMDEIFINKDVELLYIIPLIIIAISITKGAATYIHMVKMKVTGQRIVTDMQIDLYRKLLYMDIKDFHLESSGKIVSRFANDIQIIKRNLTNTLIGVARETLTLIALIAVMCYNNLELAAAFLIFGFAVYPIIRIGKKINKLSRKQQEEFGVLTSKLDDTFQGIKIVKAYNNEEYEIKKASTIMENIYNIFSKAAKTESLSSPIMESLAGVTIAFVVFYGGLQVLEGETTAGAFTSFIVAILMAYKPLKSLTNLNNIIQEGLAAIKRIHDLFNIERTIIDSPDSKELNTKVFDIDIENLVFSYNKGSIESAINGISFHLNSGETLALVGHSGSGKSTIANLLMRYYKADSGSIKINNTNIDDITIESLRNHISYVNQEATLFDDTIRNNIAYGKIGASDEEIIKAAKKAGAHDFITEQPNGYDTHIGQRGLKISGGQKQRIAIARAFIHDTPFILLDEATSALDTISEKHIQKALSTLMKGRTTIVIAHRLSTIINADKICVLDKGKIIEEGTHEELLKNKGEYFSLYEKQFED